VDSSNKSYYGKSSLHYLSSAASSTTPATNGNASVKDQSANGAKSDNSNSNNGGDGGRVDLGDGPIHSIAWSPNSKEFLAIHGTMPAKATLFDHRANPIYSFPPAPRNSVSYSPHGRFVAIGGFGNLKGDVVRIFFHSLMLFLTCFLYFLSLLTYHCYQLFII
jgi:translation initiation factor 2A